MCYVFNDEKKILLAHGYATVVGEKSGIRSGAVSRFVWAVAYTGSPGISKGP